MGHALQISATWDVQAHMDETLVWVNMTVVVGNQATVGMTQAPCWALGCGETRHRDFGDDGKHNAVVSRELGENADDEPQVRLVRPLIQPKVVHVR